MALANNLVRRRTEQDGNKVRPHPRVWLIGFIRTKKREKKLRPRANLCDLGRNTTEIKRGLVCGCGSFEWFGRI